MAFKLASCTVAYDFVSYPLERTVKSISGIGFAGIETGFPPQLLANGRRSLSQLLKKYELEPAKFNFGGFELAQPDAKKARETLRAYKKYILLANDNGFPAMVTSTGPAPPGLGEERSIELAAGALAQIADYGKDHGVRITLELYKLTLGRDVDAFLKLHKASASNNLFANVDPGSYWVAGDDAVSAVKRLGGLVGGVHVKDVVKVRGKTYWAPPGSGVVDWVSLLKALKSSGYDERTGWLDIEYEGGISGRFEKDPEKGSRQSYDYIRLALKKAA